MLIPLLHEQMMVLILNLLVFPLGLKCCRREHLNTPNDPCLLIKDFIGDLFSPLVLDVVYLLVEHLT